MKLVGGDSGRVEREEFIDEVLLSPSERAIVDVLFDQPGEVHPREPDPGPHLRPRPHHRRRRSAAGEAAAAFDELRVDPELTAERERIQADIEREPDKTLAFVSQMPILYGGDAGRPRVRLPDAPRGHRHRGGELSQVRDEADPGRVGADVLRLPDAPGGHGHRAGDLPEVRDEAGSGRQGPRCRRGTRARSRGHEHGHDHADGLEWEDLMPEINRQTNTRT